MNPPANANPSHQTFFLEVISGNDKGEKFQTVSNKVSIGRAKDNDIVLKDPKISRKHAILYVTPEGLQITRVHENRQIFVGRHNVANAILELPSLITLGKTKIRITEQSRLPINQPIHNLDENSRIPARTAPNVPLNTSPNLFAVRTNNSKTRFYVIVAVLIGGMSFLLSDSQKEDEEENELVTEEQQERQISSIKEKSDALRRSQQQTGRNSPQYRQAKGFFIQGLRDYREKNYLRAIDYFNGALALFPDHALSQRYLNQAHGKQNELIQLTLLDANDHYEKKRYKQARASYEQLLYLIRDKNNKVYRQARERFEECGLIMQQSF